MSETKLATKADLKEMYDRMLPYLGGSADAGFTPVGTVISVMGVNAPANYLKCDGTVYNIADYPELANYFYQQFGSKNKFGGNGTTTFAVPDLRGEFLRGTGTNSHANQGSGANVGVHQDGTIHPYEYVTSTGTGAFRGYTNNDGAVVSDKHDSLYTVAGHGQSTETRNAPSTTFSGNSVFTSRPTNTSVLYCIATKNIYLNPALDYSTEEKVVGTWIDGKPLYQKTIDCGAGPNTTTSYKDVNHSISNIDKIVGAEIFGNNSNTYVGLNGTYYNPSSIGSVTGVGNVQVGGNTLYAYVDKTKIHIQTTADKSTYSIYATIRYTKTTDA